jgi:hypothetical protein
LRGHLKFEREAFIGCLQRDGRDKRQVGFALSSEEEPDRRSTGVALADYCGEIRHAPAWGLQSRYELGLPSCAPAELHLRQAAALAERNESSRQRGLRDHTCCMKLRIVVPATGWGWDMTDL